MADGIGDLRRIVMVNTELAAWQTLGGGQFWVSLENVAPDGAGAGGTEVTGTGYARKAVLASYFDAATVASAGAPAIALNNTALVFGFRSASAWTTANYIACWSHATSRAANYFLGVGTITVPGAPAFEEGLRIPAGSLSIRLNF